MTPTKYCPENQPYRCIMNGNCVEKASQCVLSKNDLNALKDTRFELINPIISSKCNSYKPIKCSSGLCVKTLNDCINDKRMF